MNLITGDNYLNALVGFVQDQTGPLLDSTVTLKLNPVGLHYIHTRLESLSELEDLLLGAPVDYLRAYVSDLGDHRALEGLRRILRLLTNLKIVGVLNRVPYTGFDRDPTPVYLTGFGRLKVLEIRGCDLSKTQPKGLVDLRFTLEKLICHNSTDALRHVFASRIAEIKDSPVWNRLSFVSCALNGLLLMDESLQLLPVVETLDLSRNKFAKVDNLRKCTRLKHLDLGFNQLRTVSSFNQVCSHLVKLVLRNNALTNLRGIENLKRLEGLDLSYNIISNFSELEILSGLPTLLSLWLEGNPICCARWYRSQVFCIFLYPEKLTLDGNKICTQEFWEVQIINASRQKQPASFGFYSPAKGDMKVEGTVNTTRKKYSRLASIESEEQAMHSNSEEESVACENDTLSKVEDIISEEEIETVDLVERIEKMKKERSDLWLREIKNWLIQDSESCLSNDNSQMPTFDADKKVPKRETRQNYLGESSRYTSDAVQVSGDESSANMIESDSSFADPSSVVNSRDYNGGISEAYNFSIGNTYGSHGPLVGCTDGKQEQVKSCTQENDLSVRAGINHPDLIPVPGGEKQLRETPHYQDDILHRRQNLMEEFLQLSAKSFSVASSDSNTSCSEDDFTEYGPSIPDSDLVLIEELSERSSFSTLRHLEDSLYQRRNGISQIAQNGAGISASNSEPTSGVLRNRRHHNLRFDEHDGEVVHYQKQVDAIPGKKSSSRNPQRKLIALVKEIHDIIGKTEPELSLNGDVSVNVDKIKDNQQKPIHHGAKSHDTEITLRTDGIERFSGSKYSTLEKERIIEQYFNTDYGDKGVGETCKKCITCNCIVDRSKGYKEREVAILLSSDCKLYVMRIDSNYEGTDISISLMSCHRIEGVKLVLVGLGLQFLRVYIENGGPYLLVTRSFDKSTLLLSLLQCLDSEINDRNCRTKSVEQIQVELFQRDICGCLEFCMYQYAMILFWCSNMTEDIQLSRSLFVLEQHLLVCNEDFMRYGSLSVDMPPYFTLDSCCSINDVTEMVIDTTEGWNIRLTIENATTKFCGLEKMETTTKALSPLEWKLKWFNENSLFNFVALVKAIHAGASNSSSPPLLVRSIS